MKDARWIILLIILLSSSLFAQTPDILANAAADSTLLGAPVVYNGKVIFYLYSYLGNFSPFERSVIIGKRLEELGLQKHLYPDSLQILEYDNKYDICYLDHLIMSVSSADSLIFEQPVRETPWLITKPSPMSLSRFSPVSA